MKKFITFIQEQGVVGLAVGFILGGSVSKLVSSIVNDLLNPILGLVLNATNGLNNSVIKLGSADILIGNFFSNLVDFVVIAAVVYFLVKGLKLDTLDKKKS